MWIELITQSNDERFQGCSRVFSEVEKRKAELWTSIFTVVEVYRRKCDDELASLPEDQDDEFESFFKSGLVKPVFLDMQVAKISRRLCRKYPELRKPQDAVHVASCVVGNINVMHTFDRDLIKLDGRIPLENGNFLKITEPSASLRNGQLEIE